MNPLPTSTTYCHIPTNIDLAANQLAAICTQEWEVGTSRPSHANYIHSFAGGPVKAGRGLPKGQLAS